MFLGFQPVESRMSVCEPRGFISGSTALRKFASWRESDTISHHYSCLMVSTSGYNVSPVKCLDLHLVAFMHR